MRAIIAILEGPEQAREEPDKEAFLDNPVERKRDTRRRESAPPRRSTPVEPAPMQPQNPPMEVKPPAKPPMDAKPAKPQVKKNATILKQLKAQDKKAEDKKAETKEILKKGMDEFFSKQASKAPPKASKAPKSRAVSVPPPKLPTPSFDEIAAQLDQDSFLDNPVDWKRDTRRREAAGNATSVGATQASNRSVSARPPSGARVLKTQRADSEGRRRTTLNTMVR